MMLLLLRDIYLHLPTYVPLPDTTRGWEGRAVPCSASQDRLKHGKCGSGSPRPVAFASGPAQPISTGNHACSCPQSSFPFPAQNPSALAFLPSRTYSRPTFPVFPTACPSLVPGTWYRSFGSLLGGRCQYLLAMDDGMTGKEQARSL